MQAVAERQTTHYGRLAALVVLAIGGGLGYLSYMHKRDVAMTANFTLSYPPAATGWKAMRHGPQTLFLYGNTAKGLLLRGAVNQVISNVNPTPDLDRDNLAKLMVDNTHDNMPGWTASVEDAVQANGTSFRLVRRSEHKHVVVTAFAVKGNTTVLISLSGRDKYASQVDRDMDEFHRFISKLTLTKADSSRW